MKATSESRSLGECDDYRRRLEYVDKIGQSLVHTRWAKNDPICLSEGCQIFTKFANFWHTEGQDDRIM